MDDPKAGTETIFWAKPEDTTPPAKAPIDWECPCLGPLRNGPCETEFRTSFECVHYSETENAEECFESMRTMHECVARNVDAYPEYADIVKSGEDDAGNSGAAATPKEERKPVEEKQQQRAQDKKTRS